ncbi:MAG: (2Fe-2S)-binding protein [Gammaproteobacteria bacterium]|nr:MAG: (2Fe-2S)-binding protein [Gammaproteobacteria bacterium]
MISLMINGNKHQYDDDENMPLLWVLRDILKYTGTKYGCGKGLCGACTVHLDGKSIRSCTLPVSAVGKQKITTIEGLSANGEHALQQAWQKLNVPQCGYCQSGQLMSAAALLAQTPKPTEQEIELAMSGNLCRCGTYNRIKAGIQMAAGMPITSFNFDELALDEVAIDESALDELAIDKLAVDATAKGRNS